MKLEIMNTSLQSPSNSIRIDVGFENEIENYESILPEAVRCEFWCIFENVTQASSLSDKSNVQVASKMSTFGGSNYSLIIRKMTCVTELPTFRWTLMLLDQIKKITTICALQGTRHPPKSHSRQVKLISCRNYKDYILSLRDKDCLSNLFFL